MPDLKNGSQLLKKIPIQVIGILLLIFTAVFLLWFNYANSNQAISAMVAKVRFQGEYCVGDGQWQKIIEGEHIHATKGDVTLRGDFHLYAPDGEYAGLLEEDTLIALYTDHINLTIQQGESEPYIIDMENPLYDENLPHSTHIEIPHESINAMLDAHNQQNPNNQKTKEQFIKELGYTINENGKIIKDMTKTPWDK